MRKRDPIELLTPDGQKLRGIFSYSPNSQSPPVIVFAHGFGSIHSGDKATAIEAECVKRNWAFIACDFRGHGESDGVMNELLGRRPETAHIIPTGRKNSLQHCLTAPGQ